MWKPLSSPLILLLTVSVLTSACAQAKPAPTPTALAARPVSPQVSQRIDLAQDLYLRQIGDGAYVITYTFPWSANALLVEMADGTLVLAGMPWSPEATRQVLNWAQKQFGQRKWIAIDTGYHIDNMGGNQALLEAGIPVYGSDRTAQLIRDKGEQSRQGMLAYLTDPRSAAYQTAFNMAFLPPDHTFPIDAGLKLSFGGEDVQIYYPGPSQAPDKVAVYFPARKLLFGSCMVIGMDQMGNTADADMQQWPQAIQKLEQFPADVIVPGHGDRLGPDLLQHTLDLLER